MTLYRGQKAKYDKCIFGPELLRRNTVECIKSYIRSWTGITDVDFALYKSELADCYFPKLSFPSLHKELVIDDHIYYFFLSVVNAWLKAQENKVTIDSKYSGFFQQFITTSNGKIEPYTLSSPQHVRKSIEILLKKDATFDGYYLNTYSFFQHLNFVSPRSYPSLLLDWTSDINVAALFSIDESGKIGTVVSMEYPNELYHRFDAFSGTTFFNAYGCACTQKDKRLPYSLFDNLLMQVQKATCLYWPYNCTLEDLKTKYKEALGFRILSEDEVRKKILNNP